MSTRSMDVFSLRDSIVGEYRKFATSFTTIHAEDIRAQVEAIYSEGRFWPDPLLQINPSYKRGLNLETLIANGALDPQTADIFRADGAPLSLYKHQEQAVERPVVQRVGQNLFRDGLLDLWEGRCAVTGLAMPALLRASHIKPWAECETDAERLDVYNGILLAPHLDAAFDRGFITVADDGAIVVSDALDADARRVLMLDRPLRVRGLADGHRGYLPWHRERVFLRRQEGVP